MGVGPLLRRRVRHRRHAQRQPRRSSATRGEGDRRRTSSTLLSGVTLLSCVGLLKQIAFTDNKVSAVFDDLVHYSTDTEPGSSGSPVFNQDWEIVGLHHRGGGLAGPDGKKYFTNEAIQIGSVVRSAAAFLGLSDELYDLAFGDLRAALVGLANATEPPTDPDDVARDVLLKRPRFSFALARWSTLNAVAGQRPRRRVAIAGAPCSSAYAGRGRGSRTSPRRPSRDVVDGGAPGARSGARSTVDRARRRRGAPARRARASIAPCVCRQQG